MADGPPTGQERICDSILDTIGGTPMVRLSRLAVAERVTAEILAKLEFFNPLGSVKDRIGLAMIEDLERSGRLTENTVLVEPTSGNTGIALAFVAAAKGYRLILPCRIDVDGAPPRCCCWAELELTPSAQGMQGHRQAEEWSRNYRTPSCRSSSTTRQIR